MKKLLPGLVAALSLLYCSVVSADLTDIDNAKLQSLIEAGVPVVDVRRVDEWQKTGVVEDSHLLTFFDKHGRYDAQKWLADLSQLIDPQKPFVVICQSGVRSLSVGKWLGQQFDTVYNVENGIARWIKDGNATVAAE